MKKITDFNFGGKRVLVRCDFNVPLSQGGEMAKKASPSSLSSFTRAVAKREDESLTSSPPSETKILDDFRIRKTIPTIKYLIERKAKLILLSHLEVKGENFSLRPIAKRLEKFLKRKINFFSDCIGKDIEEKVLKMKDGDIILLENVRFHPGEKENDLNFAKSLAGLGEIFINEAFSVCHRNHASVVGITKFLPSGAGPLLIEEVETLSKLIRNPKKPLIIIIGGSKAKDKARVIDKFLEIADWILIGNLIFKEIKEKIKGIEKIASPFLDEKALDLDKKTIENFKEKISLAKTIFWSGPLGKIEEKKYQKGTREITKSIIEGKAFSVVGGGDTIEFLNKIGILERFNYVSVGGGAMLKFLAGEKLPGIEALK